MTIKVLCILSRGLTAVQAGIDYVIGRLAGEL